MKKSAWIDATVAEAHFPRFDRANVFLMDPDNPKMDANDLLKERGGQMLDPRTVNHGCPFCGKVLAWDLFTTHAEYCFKKWRKVVRGLRIHQGATLTTEVR